MPLDETPDFMRAVPEPPRSGGGALPAIDPAKAVAIPDEPVVDYTPEWRERIAAIRDADASRNAAEVIVLLGNDARLVRLIAAWSSVPILFEAPGRVSPDEMGDTEVLNRCWAKLWNPAPSAQSKEALPNMVANASGLSMAETQVALRVAVQTRSIYPDGGMHAACAHFLRAEATAVLLNRGATIVARAKAQ